MGELNYDCRLPAPQAPMVDADTGLISQAWYRWALSMLTRTGGNSGTEAAALAEIVANLARLPSSVTLGASPFVFTASSHGSLLVSGGGVIRLEISADGTTWFVTGSYYGAFPLNKSARARLTYIGTPQLTFIPG